MPTVQQHFKGREPNVRKIYDEIVGAAGSFGPFTQEAKKTSIHFVRKAAFAGIATRKDAVILTLKSAADVRSPRIARRQRASANRWYLEIRLDDSTQVDAELRSWLKKSIELSDQRSTLG